MAAVLAGMSLAALAQDAGLQAIEKVVVEHRNKALQEKLFVHTDKKVYLAGEFLWFKLYYVEGYTHQPLHLSRLAYVELLNAGNQPVLQATVSLKASEDNGSLYLPLNLPTGNYKLRSYTAWMKNFSADFFFEKEISIINPLSTKKEQGEEASVENAHQITFFPEGGELVKGLSSTLAFKGADAYGRGLSFTGWIQNERGDSVASFSPLKFGMGTLPFTPTGNHVYTATVLFADGKRIKRELPAIRENGYVMHLQKASPSQIKIEVKTTTHNGAQVFLIAHTRQVIQSAQETRLNNGTAVFTVDATRFEPGIAQFTVFDAARQPVAERLCFIPSKKVLQADVQTDKKEYASREKISLSLRTLNANGAQAPANLSLSVFRMDSVQVPDEMNIENYLLLTSDLAGFVEAPSYYFEEAGAGREQATDNLMMTQGWRRFRWRDVLDKKEPFVAAHPPEVNGQLITGKVVDTRTGQPAASLQTSFSLSGKQSQVNFAETNSSGQFQFEVKDHYGSGEMMIRPFVADDSLYRVELQNAFSTQYTTRTVPPLALPEREERLLANYSVGMQVRQVYAGDSLNQLAAPQPADSFSFLGTPDYTYNLDEYTRFTTMEEVLREYVRPINVGVRRGKPHMIFINQADRTPYDNNLLVMIDGVPISNPDRVFDYDPLKVKKLEIFPRAYVMGPMYFFGVANFSTYKGIFDAFELDPHLVALDYQGLQMQREFYAPSYETQGQKNSRLPDYRNTLYWNSDIHTAASGSTLLNFYSCDQKGRYLGLLQGMDNHGHPIVSRFVFEVK